jgi:hypothetical protein
MLFGETGTEKRKDKSVNTFFGFIWKFAAVFRAFAKFIKATVTFVMYVCWSVRMKQHFSYWTDFHEI